MLAEIITIGDEILIGQTVDTNSAWLGKRLNQYGIEVIQISSINDKQSSIIDALKLAESRADVILITGGLGPTKDDITKKVLADYFNTQLVQSDEALDNIKAILSRKGRSILQTNIDQALVPENCTPILNHKGTAPGMYFEKNNKVYVSMPGVPYEMKDMMERMVFEKLNSIGDNYSIVHHTITVVGVPESLLADQIEAIEDSLPSHLKLAYLPHLNLVRLRLSGKSISISEAKLREEVNDFFDQIKESIGNVWFDGEKNLAELVGALLHRSGNSLGTCESCSGGFIAHKITAVPGSSAYYKGSIISYAYDTKVKIVDINQDTLNKLGAVSEEVCKSMALNAREKLDVDYCISTTGIAGPSGGTATKPVGLVYIGIAGPNGFVQVKRHEFHGTREQVIERTAFAALEMLRLSLSNSKATSS